MRQLREKFKLPNALIRIITCSFAVVLILMGSILAEGCSTVSETIRTMSVTSSYGRAEIRIALLQDLVGETENSDTVDQVLANHLKAYAQKIEVDIYTTGGTKDSFSHKALKQENYDYIVLLLGTGRYNIAITENSEGLTAAYTKELKEAAETHPEAKLVCLYDLYDIEGEVAIEAAIAASGVEAFALDMKDYDSHLDRGDMSGLYQEAGILLARYIAGQESIRDLDPSKPSIALTFDDGPNTTTTTKILDVLEQYEVKASFFLIGSNISASTKAVVQRELALGCEVNSHSYAHAYMNKMTAEEIEQDMQQAESQILSVTGGIYPMFFRPPYIAVNDTMYENILLAFICGYGCNDWDNSVSAEERVSAVLANAKDGEVILLHDAAGNQKTVDALPQIIEGLREKGYQLVTCTQLFALKGIVPDSDTTYTFVTQ